MGIREKDSVLGLGGLCAGSHGPSQHASLLSAEASTIQNTHLGRTSLTSVRSICSPVSVLIPRPGTRGFVLLSAYF